MGLLTHSRHDSFTPNAACVSVRACVRACVRVWGGGESIDSWYSFLDIHQALDRENWRVCVTHTLTHSHTHTQQSLCISDCIS